MPEALDSTPSDQLCSLPRHLTSATAARIVLRGFLSDLKDGEHYAEAGELIVTELVATAVLTPRTPEHLLIDVLFEHSAPSGLRIEVHDTGLPGRGRSALGAEGSPGFRLVRELSSSCGHELTEGELVTNRFWACVAPPRRPSAP
ncbi:hypothetical protein ACFVVX_22290 [Kitasatospora sp. NPDC058170]|uniref:hypothetical protein n=1 Tax=Kitasatospora sp. NPDC058170 TaxID=3346364 RepID=UPI0036DD1C5C